ncbi:hypothetical protein UlMin_021132 [Ulmus minor]
MEKPELWIWLLFLNFQVPRRNTRSTCKIAQSLGDIFINKPILLLNFMDPTIFTKILRQPPQLPPCQPLTSLPTHSSFYDNGTISIILEYLDGGSLYDFLKKVLKGLLYLHHERHIIHRDLKPSNLLINHRGEVKITDFGVSTIMESTSGQASAFLGTYNYMSRIIGGQYGYKSDIWSLWLVLLECATGHFPYIPPEGNEKWTNFFELMDSIVNQPPPSALSKQFSPEFCSFISECVQKDPQNRQSMHPFITMYKDLDVDLKSYFTNTKVI